MVSEKDNRAETLIVDTSAFIKNVNLQDIGKNIVTVPEVLNEIKSKRQIRRLVVLPYDLQVKEAFPENVQFVIDFAKKTGDYRSLSATDVKVIALTYQLEKERSAGDVTHLRQAPDVSRTVDVCKHSAIPIDDVVGFYNPNKRKAKTSTSESVNTDEKEEEEGDVEQNKIADKLAEVCTLKANEEKKVLEECEKKGEESREGACDEEVKGECNIQGDDEEVEEEEEEEEEDGDGVEIKLDETDVKSILVKVNEGEGEEEESDYGSDDDEDDDDDDDSDWITVDNIKEMKQMMEWDNVEEKAVDVACLTTDFAMQNVLKQIGLNVASLDGKVIKQVRTFILRCYACFRTTSVMTKLFCPHCGNRTLKKVAVSVDAEGKQTIHINMRKPLTARGKKFSLPTPVGGKHANYPLLCEDQPRPDQRPTRLAKMRNNPLEPDYIAGFSPFVMRDVNSKSAMLGIANQGKEVKYWMRRNPNEAHRRCKKKK
ncbi:RNA-binding protein NOB1 [Nilaparvata lugens]|uniref:RNA-binding protein NOB1 n=1 Tax=Nilaparvata lugens TaxID=108931 RepID=UPI00193E5C94|nr:RNA-binding protein NOB1 [Nilaparvata lugens]